MGEGGGVGFVRFVGSFGVEHLVELERLVELSILLNLSTLLKFSN